MVLRPQLPRVLGEVAAHAAPVARSQTRSPASPAAATPASDQTLFTLLHEPTRLQSGAFKHHSRARNMNSPSNTGYSMKTISERKMPGSLLVCCLLEDCGQQYMQPALCCA